jgi:hypothetical protein
MILSNYDKVKWFLENRPNTRDSDLRLIAEWWRNECNKQGLDKEDFLDDFAQGKYTKPESIRRCRQKVQEDCPNLRGKTYKKRKQLEIEVRNEIKQS